MQIGDFTPFRETVRKLVVMITDSPPDGFCDSGASHLDHAALYAAQAGLAGVKINAVQVQFPDGSWHATTRVVMLNYCQATSGWFSEVPRDGGDIVRAVLKMAYEQSSCPNQ